MTQACRPGFKRVLVGVDEDLWRRMRERARQEGRPVKDLVADAIWAYLPWYRKLALIVRAWRNSEPW